MDQQIRIFRVFIASPSDLGDERQAAREVVEELNAICSKETDLRIELLGWEDTLPGTGRPQALINADLDKADLFVGCLWQRIGSQSGILGKTGFEEEFDRALARNHSTDVPEMWLFLKEVDAVRAADPGDQLRKVLEFRNQQVASKQLLFKEFKDVNSWREIIRGLLLRRLFQAVKSQPADTKEELARRIAPVLKQATDPGTATKSTGKLDPAFTSLAEIVELAGERIRAQVLLNFDRTEALPPVSSARLFLFAATNYDWNSQHIEFGTHEINSVYWHREAIQITAQERLFLLRSILLDPFQTKPGWYWVNEWKRPPSIWLPYLSAHDSDERMRLAAIQLAARLGFPLGKGKKNSRPINVVLNDSKPMVRIAGLNFLALHGRKSDEYLIRSLLADSEQGVRAAAERSLRILRLRISPDAELNRSLQERDTFDEDLVGVLAKSRGKLTNDVLGEAILHPSDALRSFASHELFSRGALTKETAIRFTTDDARAVRQHGYMYLAVSGDPLNIKDVKAALRSTLYVNESSWSKGDFKPVVSAIFARMSEDELLRQIVAFDDESALAMEVFGNQLPKEKLGFLRKFINGDLDELAANAKTIQNVQPFSTLLGFWGSHPCDVAKNEIEVAILEILADKPTSDDRLLFLRYLSPDTLKSGQLKASLRGLGKVGIADDRFKLSPFLSSKSEAIERIASQAFLSLSPSFIAAANDLLVDPTKVKLWCIVSRALETKDASVWTAIEPFLSSTDDDMRRMASYFALRTFTKKTLATILKKYISGGFYYYNVVVHLDRALYAPRALAALFLEDETKWAEKWA